MSYQILYNSKRSNIAYGNIEYINLKIQNKNLEYFLFKTDDGFYDYEEELTGHDPNDPDSKPTQEEVDEAEAAERL